MTTAPERTLTPAEIDRLETPLERVMARVAAAAAPVPALPTPAPAPVDAQPDLVARIDDLEGTVADLNARLEVLEGAAVDDAMSGNWSNIMALPATAGLYEEPVALPVVPPFVGAVTKSEGDAGKFSAGDYAYVPDPQSPSTWKLRLTATPGGAPDAGLVGAAAAALSPAGYRGNRVEIPAADRAKVVNKVRSAWRKASPDKPDSAMPDSIKP